VCGDSEPFDDWLSGGEVVGSALGDSDAVHVGDPHVGEYSSPAVEMCMELMEISKPRIKNSGCTSSIDASPCNALTNFIKKDEFISLGNSEFKVKSEGLRSSTLLQIRG
jgi:hypothetical protein